jgi:Amt family ammonium transporter
MTFAMITPALIIGALPDRVSFPFLLLFVAGWVLIVSVPVAHWVWGQGWLAASGTIDFAGGIVVHTTAGVSALVMALLIGLRQGFTDNLLPPHSPGLTMAGYSKYILCSEAYGMESSSRGGATASDCASLRILSYAPDCARVDGSVSDRTANGSSSPRRGRITGSPNCCGGSLRRQCATLSIGGRIEAARS